MAWQALVEVARVSAEVAEKTANKVTTFNPDKRLDPNKLKSDKASNKFNPDKRIDIKESLEKVLEQYKNELANLAECPETIKNLADLKLDDLKKLSPEEVSNKRKEFKNKRERLRVEWEKENGRPWPTYEEEVKNERGEVIKRPGDKLDAHHVKPLSLGGENVASNITPMTVKAHQEIHASKSACSVLQNAIR